MRVKTVQINWHDKLPIFSIDFDHNYTNTTNGGWRFATGGGDNNVRIWRLRTPSEREADAQQPAVEFLASLNRHTAPVNVVRFAPGSSRLASAGDDGVIIIWRQVDETACDDPEAWRPAAMLRGSLADICDLAWSPCGRYIASASVDNTARIWDARDARCLQVLANHSHYVQGVAWDPLGEFLVTQSSDRSLRTYRWHRDVAEAGKPGSAVVTVLSTHYSMPRVDDDTAGDGSGREDDEEERKHNEVATEERTMDVDTAEQTKPTTGGRKTQRLFHDDNLTSFFRRPAISPDGRLVATAAGVQRDRAARNTCFVWARDSLQGAPVLSLGGHAKPVVATRWTPCRFRARKADDGNAGWIAGDDDEAARMMLAVATQNSVAIYDTSVSGRAVGLMSGLHYAAITDVAWCRDGSHLVIASIDGFASVAAVDQPTEPLEIAAATSDLVTATRDASAPAEQSHDVSSASAADAASAAAAAAASEAAAAEAARQKGKKRLAPTFVSTL
ncbi:Chromatin assembly factor 1 subunit [Coemansia interrupta]|uniref:Chromatin assembly factor 1 subunit n=1 Tax=Coemansia interrupta TaxID=1126814 RepID=A0A9W8LJ61_9FUNG|nr:Chromatin assembly factor 1 subunit [Coemansia interrupta]